MVFFLPEHSTNSSKNSRAGTTSTINPHQQTIKTPPTTTVGPTATTNTTGTFSW